VIYVRVELWPYGLKDRATLLGEATISNVGGDARRGNYDVRLSRTSPMGHQDKVGFAQGPAVAAARAPGKDTWRCGSVTNYARLSKVMWHLIAEALTAACKSEPLHKRSKDV